VCKSITAKQLFKRFPGIEEELWGGHFWSEGGCIDTVGDGYDVKKKWRNTFSIKVVQRNS